MQIVLLSNEKNNAQLKDDLLRLQKEIVFPFTVSDLVIESQNVNSSKHAETFWDRKRNKAEIKFYSRYFKVNPWKKRVTTFLHELSHIGLFSSEDKSSDWMEMLCKLKLNRIETELNEMRYNTDMQNFVFEQYAELLQLPLEFLAEEYFKREFPDFFNFRKDAYYALRTSWTNSLEEWTQKTKWKGSEYLAPYAVYSDLLRVTHFMKIIENDDKENLSRFNLLYQKRKDILKELCDEKLFNYFYKNENRFTDVALSPLYFNENNFLELADRLWSFPRTY